MVSCLPSEKLQTQHTAHTPAANRSAGSQVLLIRLPYMIVLKLRHMQPRLPTQMFSQFRKRLRELDSYTDSTGSVLHTPAQFLLCCSFTSGYCIVYLYKTPQLGSFYLPRLPKNDADTRVHQKDRRQVHREGTHTLKMMLRQSWSRCG